MGAVVFPMFDIGRKTAAGPLPDGPFFGVPFLLKDLLAAYAGVPMTGGCKALKNFVPDFDSEMVRRFKNAGLVILGKNQYPGIRTQRCYRTGTLRPLPEPLEHRPYPRAVPAAGRPRRWLPAWFLWHRPETAADPSAFRPGYCGLFGIKPSRGRNPSGPAYGRIWQDAVQEHVISRSVRDSAAMLDCTLGPDMGAPYMIKPPQRPYMEEITKDPGRLKIAFCTRSPIDTPVHPECVAAIETTAKLLEDLGHHVEAAEPDLDGKGLAESYLIMYFGEMAADIKNLTEVLGRKAKIGDVEDLTWTLGLLGNSFSAGEFVNAIRRWDVASRKMGEFFQTYDLYLTPTTAFPPPRIGELNPSPAETALMKLVNKLSLGRLLKASGIAGQMAEKSLEKMPFTQLANFTGLPAMSVPLYWTKDNLPVGSHFMAPAGDEATLFKLAAQIEKAQPWFDRRPASL